MELKLDEWLYPYCINCFWKKDQNPIRNRGAFFRPVQEGSQIEGRRQKGYCLSTKLFIFFGLVGYFCHAALAIVCC